MKKDDLDGDQLVDAWKDENKAWSFEGDSGLDKLTKLVKVLGYCGHGFKHGSPVEEFLSDNPGAQEAIVEFIAEFVSRNRDWHEALSENLDIHGEDECTCEDLPTDGTHSLDCPQAEDEDEGE